MTTIQFHSDSSLPAWLRRSDLPATAGAPEFQALELIAATRRPHTRRRDRRA